jgi:endonuclease/exonuclease/phosphatase family metal-dependent hydrolase/ribosomal protein S18 acetylase RimI-like enzyme
MRSFLSQALAKRIEQADAVINTAYIEAQRAIAPEFNADHLQLAGGALLFAGPKSPINRAVGLGFHPIDDSMLRQLEAWFSSRQCPIRIEVCPLVSSEWVQLLAANHYRLLSFKNTWALALEGLSLDAPETSVDVRQINTNERELWAQTIGKGFASREEKVEFDVSIGRPTSFSTKASCFLGFINQEAVGGASVAITDNIAQLSSMSTRVAFRRQGVQQALLQHRLKFAQEKGCEWAIVHTTPTNTNSQHNVERLGFRLLYTQITLGTDMTPGYSLLEARGVCFTASFPNADTVLLAGDFTDWEKSPLRLTKNVQGLWQAQVTSLSIGLHFYKYIVDGVWQSDPHNPNRYMDGFGDFNSTFLISTRSLALGGSNALRIASINLHTYQESEPLHKLKIIADTFAALEVHAIALQEVGQHRLYPARQPNAGEYLRKTLEVLTGVPWYHEWRFAHIGFDDYDEGVSLLSRLPLHDVQEHNLNGKSFRRVAVSASLPQGLRLTSVHTSWPSDGGVTELELLLQATSQGEHLFAGDFNAAPYEANITKMKQGGFVDVGALFKQTASTFKGGQGPAAARLDYHLLRASRWRPISFTPLFHGSPVAQVPQPWVSDHTGLLGVYEPIA